MKQNGSKQRLRFFTLTLILLISIAFVSCGASVGYEMDTNSSSSQIVQSYDGGEEKAEALWDGESVEETEEERQPEAPARPYGDNVKLILHASLSLETTDFEQTVRQLNQLVSGSQGYFESSQVDMGSYGDSSNQFGLYTVRVPQKNYDSFLSAAGEICHVVNRNETAEDVGARYFDTEARLKTLRTKQDRLIAILAKANDMKNIVELENALSDVQYEIDRYTSELSRYDSLIDYATIDITLNQVTRLSSPTSGYGSFGAALARSFQEGLYNVRDASAGFLLLIASNFIPILILVIFIIFIWRYSHRQKRNNGKSTKLLHKRKLSGEDGPDPQGEKTADGEDRNR